MKIVILALGLLNSVAAFADYGFDCIDMQNQSRARMVMSSASQFEERHQQSCNGGVGDPIVCQPVIYLYEHKTLKISLGIFSQPVSLTMNLIKMTWKGADRADISNFTSIDGGALANAVGPHSIQLGNAAGWEGFMYSLMIRPLASANAKNYIFLRCRLISPM